MPTPTSTVTWFTCGYPGCSAVVYALYRTSFKRENVVSKNGWLCPVGVDWNRGLWLFVKGNFTEKEVITILCFGVISGFCSKVDEICTLLGHYAAYSVNSSPMFRGKVLVPSLRFKISIKKKNFWTLGRWRWDREDVSKCHWGITTMRCVIFQKSAGFFGVFCSRVFLYCTFWNVCEKRIPPTK